jgi:hypothetical protein
MIVHTYLLTESKLLKNASDTLKYTVKLFFYVVKMPCFRRFSG